MDARTDNGPKQEGGSRPDPKMLLTPNIRFYGPINDDSVKDFFKQLEAVRSGDQPLVMELTTEGGDAEGGRRIALEVRLFRKMTGRETYFVGKTVVMSAGVTIMAAFPRDKRFLTSDCVLLVHERRLQKTLNLDGPIRADIQIVREMLAQLETAERIEMEGFEELVRGSTLTTKEMYERARENCYLSAREALDLRLIEAIL